MNEMPELDVLPDAVRKQHEEALARKAEIDERRKTAAADAATAAASASTAEQAPPAAATPPAAPAAESPKPTQSTSTPATQPVEPLEQEISRLQQEKADLRRQLDSANGRYGGTVQSLKSKIFDLEQQIETKATASSAPSEPVAVTPSTDGAPPVADGAAGKPAYLKYVSEEAMGRFGDEFPGLVADIARGLDDERAKEHQAELAELSHKTTKKVDDFQTHLELERFWDEADRLAPGARVVNGDDERHVPCAEGWGTFLDEPVRPGSPLTRRQEATQSVASRDSVAFAALVREFQAFRSGVTVDGPPRATVEAQAVPQSVVGDALPAPAADETAARQIPQSEIDDFKQRAGTGNVSIEEAEAYMKEYAAAYKEGRVLVGA